MPDFAQSMLDQGQPPSNVLSSVGKAADGTTFSAPASLAWPVASRCTQVPVYVTQRFTVRRFGWRNGTAVSGNVDAGIYDASGALLTSTGSIAQATTGSIQTADCADVTIPPGQYWLALVLDNATGTIFRRALTVPAVTAMRFFTQTLAGWGSTPLATYAAQMDYTAPTAHVPAVFAFESSVAA